MTEWRVTRMKAGVQPMDEALEREVNLLHANICQGLSDPKRILMLYALRDRPMHVNELADALHVPQPTISRHLKILRERQLVAAEREGPSVLYSLADERVIDALDILRAVLLGTLSRQGVLAENMD
jgi:DNA-binding transcriptional ArsR family regulator